MEYFCLQQDMDFSPNLILTGLSNVCTKDDFIPEKAFDIPDHSVVYPISKKENQYIDILSQQFFMVTEMVKEVFSLYVPEIKYKVFCVIDNRYKIYEYYFAPILSRVSYKDMHPDPASLEITAEQIGDKPIFRIDSQYDNIVVVSLEIAESLLRREIVGAKFLPVHFA